jgi:hypothetical protein
VKEAGNPMPTPNSVSVEGTRREDDQLSHIERINRDTVNPQTFPASTSCRRRGSDDTSPCCRASPQAADAAVRASFAPIFCNENRREFNALILDRYC